MATSSSSSAATTSSRVQSPRTAFSFFLQDCRATYEAEHHGAVPRSFTEFTNEVSVEWDSMSQEDKQPFEEMARQDKQRYRSQAASRSDSVVFLGPFGRRLLFQCTVKPPLPVQSAFFLFCQDQQQDVQKENPQITRGQLSVALGKKWMEASMEIKERYEQKAQQDKERFDREMAQYSELCRRCELGVASSYSSRF